MNALLCSLLSAGSLFLCSLLRWFFALISALCWFVLPSADSLFLCPLPNKTIGKISELRQANGDLANEVNILQKSRFDMVEEPVYPRWLNVCLRAEIKEYQTSSRKTSEKGSSEGFRPEN
ncbi:hypothetical protein V6Z12_D12G167200 [Gossypium hirsutum]|uniref:Protein CHUP1, chloroplastic n=1 Tax=Gossypium hirsutum TaxID=3635 RepID=A0A1U8NA48_GOSHI|nr:protein CHUP1, chloroplastic-like [Gossypium hirsutum]